MILPEFSKRSIRYFIVRYESRALSTVWGSAIAEPLFLFFYGKMRFGMSNPGCDRHMSDPKTKVVDDCRMNSMCRVLTGAEEWV